MSKKNLRISVAIKRLDASKTRRFTFERKGFHRYNEVYSKAISKKNLRISVAIKRLDASKRKKLRI